MKAEEDKRSGPTVCLCFSLYYPKFELTVNIKLSGVCARSFLHNHVILWCCDFRIECMTGWTFSMANSIHNLVCVSS